DYRLSFDFVASSESATDDRYDGYSLFSIKAGESKVVRANIKNVPKKKGKYKVKFNICDNKGKVLPTSSGGLDLEGEFEVEDDDNSDNFMSISAMQLDVLKIEACSDDGGCTTAGGPMQLDLLDLAAGEIDFAQKVLLPDNTHELRLILSDNNTITSSGVTSSLTVPSGDTSGLKLKGQQVFPEQGGFLAGITLDLDLEQALVVQEEKGKAKGKGKKSSSDDDAVYSFKLKPVIEVGTAEVEALPENMAAVVALPDEDVTLTLGDDFSLQIPAGAVSEATIITAEEIKYFVEVKDESTGIISEVLGLSSLFRLEPSGIQFTASPKLDIRYHLDTFNDAFPEETLNILQDGSSIPTTIDATNKIASAKIEHFSDYIVSQYYFNDISKEDVNGSYCDNENGDEDKDIIDGVKHYSCQAFWTTDPQVDMIIINRKKVADNYELGILHDPAKSDNAKGTFTTQTVKKFANDYDAIVAINGGEFEYLDDPNDDEDDNANEEQKFYDTPMERLIPLNTMVINGTLKKAERTNNIEAYMAFNGNDISFLNQADFDKSFRADFGTSLKESIAEYEKGDVTKLPPDGMNGKLVNVIGRYRSILRGNYSPDDPEPTVSNKDDSKRICKHYDKDTVTTSKDPGTWLDDPQSAIGFGDDKIVFIASKRGQWNQKLDKISELCDLFMTQSAINALPLDGGGSSQLIAKKEDGYKLLNDSAQDTDKVRYVAYAIGLVPKPSGKFVSPANDFDLESDSIPFRVKLENPSLFQDVRIDLHLRNSLLFDSLSVCGTLCSQDNTATYYNVHDLESGYYDFELKGKTLNQEYKQLDKISGYLSVPSLPDDDPIIIEENQASCVGPSYWHDQTVGHDGASQWTWNSDIAHGVDNYCTYQFRGLASTPEKWEIQVFIPSDGATTNHACYEIAIGDTEYGAEVNQDIISDDWVSLGVYEAGDDGLDVSLTDVTTNEDYGKKMVGFDAIRLVPASDQPVSGPDKTCEPRLSSGGNSDVSVLPSEATLNESTTFTVTGSNLSSSVALVIDDCQNMLALGETPVVTTAAVAAASMDFYSAAADDSVTSWQFSCTPSSAGEKNVVVKDGSGNILSQDQFTISVSDSDDPPEESFTCTSGSQVQNWKNRDWQRCDDGKTYLWQEAKDYCDNLVLGGYSDWRLPTKDELKSLVVCTNGTPTPLADPPDEPYGCGSNNGGNDGSYDVPTIDPSFECQPEFYWSSTPKEVTDTSPLASKELAWGVRFQYGHAAGKNPNTVHAYVRCIR
ncbi:MAG: DUF1566 domain-containing protein, partial [Candidatus Electrothrix sp. AUS1_2]|nr:DUF1566 domain-containing protein [Candidatus Electrothrix sp. AUS1_2]